MTGGASGGWANCPSEFGTASIPIIPAPASAPLLAAPFLVRRRRTNPAP
jgi:hypothetical protein